MINQLTTATYNEKIENEYGLSPAEVEEHERELKDFYLDRELDDEWNEKNIEDLEGIIVRHCSMTVCENLNFKV